MEPTGSSSIGEEAYSLYLQARSAWRRRTPSDLRQAIRHLERAIALDGSFALACAALADCYSILMDYGIVPPRVGLTAARLAAGRAMLRGPDLAESLTATALVRQMHLDWEAAEAEFKAAIQAHPDYGIARQRYALFLAWTGRPQRAGEEIETARRIDPESPAAAASEAWIAYYGGHPHHAVELAQAALEQHPGFSSAEAVLALALVHSERAPEGEAILEGALAREPDNVSALSLHSFAQARGGRHREALQTFQDLQSRAEVGYVSPYFLAVPLQGMGMEAEALQYLEKAEMERSPQLVYLGVEPVFTSLREGPELSALLDRIGLPRGESGSGDPLRRGVA